MEGCYDELHDFATTYVEHCSNICEQGLGEVPNFNDLDVNLFRLPTLRVRHFIQKILSSIATGADIWMHAPSLYSIISGCIELWKDVVRPTCVNVTEVQDQDDRQIQESGFSIVSLPNCEN